MPKANVAPPTFQKPELRSEAPHRSHGSQHGMTYGKRGPVNHEVISGSPRAVRARLQKQGPPTSACYFAVTRRCSFVERRGIQRATAQESWEPSCIEPGAFPSVGSGSEGYEASVPVHSVGSSNGILIGHDSDFSQSCGAHSRSGSTDARLRLPPQQREHDAPLHAPRGHRAAPLPTPVRSMAVQTNRESILRHYKANGGGDSGSDSEKENADALLGQSLMSARSAMTGHTLGDNMSMLNTARSVFQDLQYPKASLQKSERMRKVTSKGKTLESFGNTDLAEALSRSVNDEYASLSQTWGIGCSGQDQRMEDRVAFCLKKLAKRAEKAYVESLASRMVTIPCGNESKALDDECAQLEAQIVEADRRIARMREALIAGPHIVELDSQNVVKDLLDRLSRNPEPQDIVDPQYTEFENRLSDSAEGVIKSLLVATLSCQQIAKRQQEIFDEKHAVLCAASAKSISSGTDILRRLR